VDIIKEEENMFVDTITKYEREHTEGKYLIVEGDRAEIQKKLNQWLSTGYNITIERFVYVGNARYTALLYREKFNG
jgi:hypothetical protein